nr:immunoglobulin heavy chain junction region [Macaca mulatta]MOW79946.1 immunoglobulin heavy chain junction region [Macaca mulatta]MOW84449.1 immunoglobulin heavy chain junction region [Macaca mulatta]
CARDHEWQLGIIDFDYW